MKHFKRIFLVLGAVFIASCGGSKGDDTPPPNGGTDDDPGTSIPNPSSATLIFPENNSECNEGAPIDELESNVTFEWNASQNTDSYTITLTNLNNGADFDTSVTTNEATITIARGTPYEWFVTSKANGTNTTAQSAKWRFFNEGPGIENFAPFPAEAIKPDRGATLNASTITLEWSATDVDNDIKDYEVFFGFENQELNSLGSVDISSIEVTVESGKTYEWRIKTNDQEGNSSTSEIFLFRIE